MTYHKQPLLRVKWGDGSFCGIYFVRCVLIKKNWFLDVTEVGRRSHGRDRKLVFVRAQGGGGNVTVLMCANTRRQCLAILRVERSISRNLKKEKQN